MEMIDDFIQVASQEFGESEAGTRAATAGLLEALREQAGAEDFRALVKAIPGAELLLHTHAAETVDHARHGLGGAVGWLLAWLGGTRGEIGLVAAMEEAGFSPAKVARFVAAFKKFATEHAGQEAVDKVFSEAQDLAILEQKGHGSPGW